MNNLLLLSAIVLVSSAIYAVLSVYFWSFIDSCMDAGHVLSALRERLCRNSMKRQGIPFETLDKAKKATEQDSFSETITHMDDFYWRVAKNDARFLAWVCVKCMTFRQMALFFNLGWLAAVFFNWSIVAQYKVSFITLFIISNFVAVATTNIFFKD